MISIGRLLVAGVLVAATLTGCGGEDRGATPASPGLYVGEISGTELFVAVAITDQAVFGYVCDGATQAQWYKGALAQDQASLKAANGEQLSAKLAADDATGSVTVAGKRHEFSLQPAKGPGAGLYRLEADVSGKHNVSGYIVLNNGRGKGLTLSDGKATKAEPLMIFSAQRRPIISPY